MLPQGASAEVTVTVGRSKDVVAVPTSAVNPEASGTTVRVMEDGVPTVRVVEVGRAGKGRTEILSGIEPGDEVVLADLDAEIDAASEVTTSETGFSGRGGGGAPAGRSAGGGGFSGC